MRNVEPTIKIEVDSDELDELIQKVNRLVELLHEAQRIIGSLVGTEELES